MPLSKPAAYETYRSRSWLIENFSVNKLSCPQLGIICNVSPETIRNWLVKLGVPTRGMSESRKLLWKTIPHPFIGRKHRPESIEKMRLNRYDASGERNGMYGKSGPLAPAYRRVKSVEERAKISEALTGKKRPNFMGENCSSWKGGKTPLLVSIRTSRMGTEWRDAVYTRDLFTCVDCGDARGGNLNAHHIVRLCDLVETHNVKTVHQAELTPDLWDVDNGVTLCKDCHKVRHPAANKEAA